MINSYFGSLGLSLNGSKSKLMLVGLGAAEKIEPEVKIGDQVVPQVDKIRYLGILLDRRLSLDAHWSTVAASGKVLMGALSRLVQGHRKSIRHLYVERVQSAFAYGLIPAAPVNQRGWMRLQGLVSYSAHLITGNHSLHGTDIIELAGISSPGMLTIKRTLGFIFDCILKGRRWGEWLELTHPDGLQRIDGYYRTGLELKVPFCFSSLLSRLQPVRALELWNAAVRAIGSGKIRDAIQGKSVFVNTAMPLIPRFPASIRKAFFV